MKWSEHIRSTTGTPLFIRNWTESSTSFQFGSTVLLKHAKALSKKPGQIYKLKKTYPDGNFGVKKKKVHVR